jgi:NADPH:quinone reductase-like Zn-dependent oxidoreductase
MRAAILREHGEVPEIGELPDPSAGDVLEIVAAGLNPVDRRIATGTFANESHPTPYVVGKEGVGRRADGSLVYFERSIEPYGAFAERTAVEPGSGYVLPEGLDPGLAVCLGVSGLAAWLPLAWRGGLQPGETVLVLAASGVVGQIAVQVAKLLGAGRIVAAARDAAALERTLALGADATVQLPGSELAAELSAAAGGDGYDLVLDPLWGAPAAAAVAAMKPFGRLVNVGQSAGVEATLSSALVRGKPVSILGYTNYTAGEERKAEAYAQMARHAAAGEIRVELEHVSLADVPGAWQREGSSHRKVIVVP